MHQLKILILIVGTFLMSSCGSDEGDENPSLSSPLALNADDITETGFTAKWVGVNNAEGYILDISTNTDFSDFVQGYQAKKISGIEETVTDLTGATEYHYRVRAYNGSVESDNSNVIKTTTEVPTNVTLKEATSGFFIGTVVQANRLTGDHDVVLKREFSSITAEYQMKMNIMYPNEGAYDWTESDAIVDYAFNNSFNLHGHALIWHNATPDWVVNYSGTDAEFETIVEDYIKTVVTRYKGKVTSWDVVNEAFEDGSGSYRNSVFYQRMGGDDYLKKCFQWAREADPDVLLFYNDYSMCSDQTKQDATFNMVDDFIANNVPIDGVGFQMHISYDWPQKDDIESATNRIVERGLKVHYSELDIRANPNNDLTSLTSSRALELKEKYKEVAALYNNIPTANQYALTIWGMKDNETWLINHYGHMDWPLLFDANFDKKEAYYGFLEGLLY
ncbi:MULTISPECIES: endo-1,4-beta-xylanase [unclassified Saccharicrinis]|uniref:endo-1,4-beta-xylanase n=1 Tax=unclassified Saccharicrinis TaxID=2646859 RepID=UPI003D32519D